MDCSKFLIFGGEEEPNEIEITTHESGSVREIKLTASGFLHSAQEGNSYKFYGGKIFATNRNMLLHSLGES